MQTISQLILMPISSGALDMGIPLEIYEQDIKEVFQQDLTDLQRKIINKTFEMLWREVDKIKSLNLKTLEDSEIYATAAHNLLQRLKDGNPENI